MWGEGMRVGRRSCRGARLPRKPRQFQVKIGRELVFRTAILEGGSLKEGSEMGVYWYMWFGKRGLCLRR